MVAFLLQKGKHFFPPVEGDNNLNVLVEVEVNGQKKFSKTKDGVLIESDTPIEWDESMFFEL
jgi:hypothetical protein